MKKRIGDMTFEEFRSLCENQTKNGSPNVDFCAKSPHLDCCPDYRYLSTIDLDKEIDLPEPPRYRPFKDTDELVSEYKWRFSAKCPPYALPLVWVSPKGGLVDQKELIFGYSSNGMVSFHGSSLNMKSLFEDYTFLDGSPCGVEVTE